MTKRPYYAVFAQAITWVCIIGLLIVVPLQASRWTGQKALAEISANSTHALNLVAENLNGELEKFSVQPLILASNPTYQSALKLQNDPGLLHAVNIELQNINRALGASEIYLMNAKGTTVASSNWSSEKSFVGRNFAFRPYFQEAMNGRLGRYFALGTTSGKRGYYFAYPVRDEGTIIGCVVLKMNVGNMESAWRKNNIDIIVTDQNDIIFLSSNPSWLFRSIGKLDKSVQRTLEKTRQYAGKPLEPLPIKWSRLDGEQFRFAQISTSLAPSNQDQRVATQEYLVKELSMQSAGWKLLLLASKDKVRWQKILSFIGTLLLATTLVLLGANIYQRRKRIEDRLRLQSEANETLEGRVIERTEEINQANERLRAEIRERTVAEERLRETQSGLVQATKLAALGQMSAGLSHEVNQPLAAIGTYADNARAFIERGDSDTALKNLVSISDLVKRLARIVQNLRTYARNESIALTNVSLGEAIENALDIVHPRVSSERVEICYAPPESDLQIEGGQVRLQQVFVNLLTNSLDAMRDAQDKSITILVTEERDTISVCVRDTGTGIAADELSNVFDPFFSTKDTGQGLGLGLSITYGIVKQFGGTIHGANLPERGAEFVVTLKRAQEQQGEAA